MVDGAVDGVVLADVDVIGIRADGQVGAVGDVGEGLVGGAGDRLGVDEACGLLIGLLGPLACDDVVGLARGPRQGAEVQRNGGELLGCAALQEQDLVIPGYSGKGAEIGLGLVEDGLEDGGAMAHLHDGLAGAPVIGHLRGALGEDLLGKDGGACGEVVDTCHVSSNRFRGAVGQI